MYPGKRKFMTVAAFLALFGGAAFIGSPSFVGAQNGSSPEAQPVSMSSPSPGWAERLKGQTITENSVEGRAERAAKVELQHQRMMDQMQKEMEHQPKNTGTEQIVQVNLVRELRVNAVGSILNDADVMFHQEITTAF